MYITYERPERLHDREIDETAPDADLSPTGETCGKTTTDVLGVDWTCTRAPHTDSEHRAAFGYRGDGPQGHVGLAWESNWGEDANRPTTTITITTTITCPIGTRQYRVAEAMQTIERTMWETFDEDDHDEVTITTARTEPEAQAADLRHSPDATPGLPAAAEYVVPVDPMDELGCDSCQ
jgi:hypothetical protein